MRHRRNNAHAVNLPISHPTLRSTSAMPADRPPPHIPKPAKPPLPATTMFNEAAMSRLEGHGMPVSSEAGRWHGALTPVHPPRRLLLDPRVRRVPDHQAVSRAAHPRAGAPSPRFSRDAETEKVLGGQHADRVATDLQDRWVAGGRARPRGPDAEPQGCCRSP